MVDASAVVEYLLRTELGVQIATIVEAPDTDLHVPVLCDTEVAAGLARAAVDGNVETTRAVEALETYADLPLTRYGPGWLGPRVLELADRFSVYDATYVALCERLEATLVTGDGDLTSAVREHLDLNVFGVTG